MSICVLKWRFVTGAFAICLFLACCSLFWGHHDARATNLSPLPEKKPDFTQTTTLTGKVRDFASSLLGFGEIPLPQKKPDFKAHPVAAAQSPAIAKLLKKYETANPLKTLSSADQKRYAEIFAMQKKGEIKVSDKILADIDNPLLIGHVLYQRYMHPKAYQSSFEELQRWLELFGDHPGAKKLYTLAQRKGSGKLKVPQEQKIIARVAEPTMRKAKRYVSTVSRSEAQQNAIQDLNVKIAKLVRSGEPGQALVSLNAAQGLDQTEQDILKSQIAAGYMYQGQADKALSLAQSAVQRSGVNAPRGAWVAALMNWHQKKYSAAARYFEMAARSPYSSGWLATAGSYWAARAHMRVGNVKAVSTWLRRGTQYPRTFYGLISTRALGRDFDFNWQTPTFTREMHGILSALPSGQRAIALVQAKQYDFAQSELLRTIPQNTQEKEALLAFAGFANLPGLSMRLANAAKKNDDGKYYDGALYPVGPWSPERGFVINESLIHAIVRQESRFNPEAESPSGAKGLMQLMPMTAEFVAGDREPELENPEINLDLGQKYLLHLLGAKRVDGDFLSLLIAYNAGPGNLAKWKSRWSTVKDPLLFIELLPSSETRAYVERVFSNYWIYRMRNGRDTPTLDAIAAGEPALYASAL